jgi:hypothetical protein
MFKTLTRRTIAVPCARWLMVLGAIGLAVVPAAASASTGPDRSTARETYAAGPAIAALGCDAGAIHGFARVKGTAANFPSIYTASTTVVDVSYNCTGGAISVRRASTGVYFVRFAGDPSKLAIAQNNADGFGTESTNNDNVLTVAHVTDTDGGASLRVEVQDVCGDCSDGTDPQNGQFTIMLM